MNADRRTRSKAKSRTDVNIAKVRLSSEILKRHLPKKASPVQDFAKRFAIGDGDYKKTAIVQLRSIIQDDVTAISLNPVSGSQGQSGFNSTRSLKLYATLRSILTVIF